MSRSSLLIMLTLIPAMMLRGQGIWNWPEDTARAREMVALYGDYMKAGKLKESLAPLEWLLENAAELNPSIYIRGMQIYDRLATSEKDNDSLRQYYQQRVIDLIDQRDIIFGSKPANKTRKAYYAYKFWSREVSRRDQIARWFIEAFDGNDGNIGIKLLPAMMEILSRTQAPDSIIAWHERLSDVAQESPEAVEDIVPVLDKLLMRSIPWDCTLVGKLSSIELRKDTMTQSKTRALLKLSLDHDCTSQDFFRQLAYRVAEQGSNANLLKLIARKFDLQGDTETAASLYTMGLDSSAADSVSLDFLMLLADLSRRGKDFASARRYARRALSIDPQYLQAYELIGDLYHDSYYHCKRGVSIVEDRAIFIAAYEQYAKAQSSKKMELVKEQFPSATEIFEELYAVGDVITTGCWINESVRIKKRD